MKKDNIRYLYIILKHIERLQEKDHITSKELNNEVFELDINHYNRLINALVEEGLLTGFEEISMVRSTIPQYKMINPSLTISGIEYLSYYSSPETFLRRIEQVTNILK